MPEFMGKEFQASMGSMGMAGMGGYTVARTDYLKDASHFSLETVRKVLVLGTSLRTKVVDSYSWDCLPTNLNVADYDLVILNLQPLEDRDLAGRVGRLDPLQFAQLIFNQSAELILIGDPDVRIGGDSGYIYAKYLLPAWITVRKDVGNTLLDVAPRLEPYLKNVGQWTYYETGRVDPHPGMFLEHYLHDVAIGANKIGAEIIPLAVNRAGKAVAFQLVFTACYQQHLYTPLTEIIKSSPVTVLPIPTTVPTEEGIRLVLGMYNVSLESECPAWIGEYVLPHHQAALRTTLDLASDLELAKQRLEAAQKEVQEERRFCALLYEQGEPLETVVREVLILLGAEVDNPGKSRVDALVIDPKDRCYAVEIKGRATAIKLEDVRQCHDWVNDQVCNDPGAEFKGLLIGNHYCKTEPGQRARAFEPNTVETAKRFKLALLTSLQLFEVLARLQTGTLDNSEFWDVLHNTDGVCTFSWERQEAPKRNGQKAS